MSLKIFTRSLHQFYIKPHPSYSNPTHILTQVVQSCLLGYTLFDVHCHDSMLRILLPSPAVPHLDLSCLFPLFFFMFLECQNAGNMRHPYATPLLANHPVPPSPCYHPLHLFLVFLHLLKDYLTPLFHMPCFTHLTITPP